MAATTLPALILGGEVGRRPGRRVRELARRRSRCRPCRAWSSAGRCSTRPATTSPRPWTPRWGCCERPASWTSSSRAGTGGRGRPFALVDHARDGRLGLQLPADPGARAAGGTHTFATGEDEAVVLPLTGRLHGGLRRAESSRSPAAAASSPGSPTSPTCPATPTVTVSSEDGGRFALLRRPRDPAPAARYGPAEGVPVELRGAGQASRQVNNFCTPGDVRGRQADRRRGAHAGRQLVVLPAAQARRGPRRRVAAGGGLLLRGRPTDGRAAATSGSTARARAGRSTSAPRCARGDAC